MGMRLLLGCCLAYVLLAGVWIVASGRVNDRAGGELLNVSYDPTRELWRDLNRRFIPSREAERRESGDGEGAAVQVHACLRSVRRRQPLPAMPSEQPNLRRRAVSQPTRPATSARQAYR